jgi:hypothetical protein
MIKTNCRVNDIILYFESKLNDRKLNSVKRKTISFAVCAAVSHHVVHYFVLKSENSEILSSRERTLLRFFLVLVQTSMIMVGIIQSFSPS